ncbi:hypothetical protein BT69DRAFT_1286407 [Atractiella rhizophila]|nr:hypothetical protein BT69DRAFT_1286407 [Atractiella rhizophila]
MNSSPDPFSRVFSRTRVQSEYLQHHSSPPSQTNLYARFLLTPHSFKVLLALHISSSSHPPKNSSTIK